MVCKRTQITVTSTEGFQNSDSTTCPPPYHSGAAAPGRRRNTLYTPTGSALTPPGCCFPGCLQLQKRDKVTTAVHLSTKDQPSRECTCPTGELTTAIAHGPLSMVQAPFCSRNVLISHMRTRRSESHSRPKQGLSPVTETCLPPRSQPSGTRPILHTTSRKKMHPTDKKFLHLSSAHTTRDPKQPGSVP